MGLNERAQVPIQAISHGRGSVWYRQEVRNRFYSHYPEYRYDGEGSARAMAVFIPKQERPRQRLTLFQGKKHKRTPQILVAYSMATKTI